MYLHTLNMPKKARVDEIIENHPRTSFEPTLLVEGYLILYNFGSKTNTRFYNDLEKLGKHVEIDKLRRGVIAIYNVNDAYSVMKLIQHYGGEISLFKAIEIDFNGILDHYG